MKQVYLEARRDAQGKVHYLDTAGNQYEPLNGLGNIIDWASNLFAPKPGGTTAGNLLRTVTSRIGGGSAQVQPQTTVPQQQPQQQYQPQQYYPQAPAPASNNNMLIIGGIAAAAVLAVVLMK